MYVGKKGLILVTVLLAGCGGDKITRSVSGSRSDTVQTNDEVEAPEPAGEYASTFGQLTTDARTAGQSGDFERAHQLAERAVELRPRDPSALYLSAAATQQYAFQLHETDRAAANKLFIESASRIRTLRTLVPKFQEAQQSLLRRAIYNEACAYAVEGDEERALAALAEAIEAGFSDLPAMAADADLASLRDHPDFKSMIDVGNHDAASSDPEEATFDFDFSLPSLDGAPLALADYKGKLLVVDFWGTWSPACHEHARQLVELRKKYLNQGLDVIGINYERGYESDWETEIQKYVNEHAIEYPCVIGDEKTRSQVPGFQGYPTTLFIDASGKVRRKVEGVRDFEYLESIAIELLGEQ